jgi:hypothetical protein
MTTEKLRMKGKGGTAIIRIKGRGKRMRLDPNFKEHAPEHAFHGLVSESDLDA